MDKSKIFVFFILFTLTSAFVIFIWLNQKPSVEISNEGTKLTKEEKTIKPVSEEDYKDSVKELMARYWSKPEDLSKIEEARLIEELRGNLLDLTVPASFKDLHLGLVISFDLIMQALKNDDPSLEGSKSKLNNLVQNYSWLK